MNAKAVNSSSRRRIVKRIRGLKDTIFKVGDIKINANRNSRWLRGLSGRFC
jgi:hypothetical protein